jgi:hypothetical protein
MSKPAALFHAAGRRRLAHMLVWGAGPDLEIKSRGDIVRRIEAALERIANKLEGDGKVQRAAGKEVGGNERRSTSL